MIYTIGNICRAIGFLAFLIMCYAWFMTSDLQLFLKAKQVTIVFFSLSIVLWLISIVAARRNR
ncbi:hypothetical protein [Lacibacter sp. H407]|uniref:hypothetical protein n=1 Tax=Lacibacter sp. H407 TaxID=3133423 RepID=UPI0030C600F5